MLNEFDRAPRTGVRTLPRSAFPPARTSSTDRCDEDVNSTAFRSLQATHDLACVRDRLTMMSAPETGLSC